MNNIIIFIIIGLMIILIVCSMIPKREHFFYHTETPTYVNGTFDLNSSLFMANLADLAYDVNADQGLIFKFMNEHHLKFDPLKNIYIDNNTDTGVLWSTSTGNKDLYISFRGTELTLANLKSDFYESLVDFPGINMNLQVSYGFLSAWLSVKDYVSTIVNTIQPNRLYITGHSSGAALATLCAFDLKYYMPDLDPIVYTFASPRVGDIGFSVHYDKFIDKSYRVQNKYDPIPRFPTTYQGYRHVKDEMLIDGKDCYVNANLPDNYPWNIEQHKISTYIDYIQSMLQLGTQCIVSFKDSHEGADASYGGTSVFPKYISKLNQCIYNTGPTFGHNRCLY